MSQSVKMTKIKRIYAALILVMFLFGGMALLLWTPDTLFEDMSVKYGNGASQFIELGNNNRLHYRDQGKSTGPTLILIHGTSASLHTWEPLISRIGEQFRLVSLDLPGHGLTGANSQRDYSRQAMVSSIWVLMDHLGITSATLVGNSLGGSIAWASALDKPERVKSLVLLAPSGAPKKEESRSNIGFRILQTSIGQSLMKHVAPRFIIESSLYQTVVNTDLIDDAMVDRYWELLRLKGNRQAMIDLANTPRDEKAWRRFSTITAPTLIIWGEEDGVLPISMLDTFEREFDQVRSIRLPGIGHLPMEEAVEKVAAGLVAFCSSSDC